jgi:energy-coupling factor transporter ATP-binding protein EcfA2
MIIGLCGKKGSGKSTVGKILNENYGYEQISFATPIKDMLKAMGLRDTEINDPVFKEIVLDEFGQSPRQLMQSLGTAWGRETVKNTIWIEALKKRLDPSVNYVIDDVRFDNEARFIQEHGGSVILVNRQKASADDEHISEAGLTEHLVDGIINNERGFKELEEQTTLVMEEILYYGLVYNS